jgi:hypothetical protein
MVRSHRVAWTIVGLTVAIDAAAGALAVLDRSVQSVFLTVMFTVVTIAFASLGALIASRQPGNVIGLLFIGVAMFHALAHDLFQNYAVYALVVAPGTVPAGSAAFWLASSALDGVFVLFMTLLLLLFPNGRPLTPRWRVAVAGAVLGGVCTLSNGFQAISHMDPPLDHMANPLLVTGAGATLIDWIGQAGTVLVAGGFVAGITSMCLRFRRSTGIERQQMKWVVAGVLFIAVLIALVICLTLAGAGDYSGFVFVASLAVFPTVMGVAILRYRLYDIDVVIRKTLVYACLVAVLALLYLGGIVILGAAFRSATGQSGALAVTLSTLIVAVAFQPLRRRLQHAIDSRFSRRSYDAETAVRAFAVHLREQIDLDALCRELTGVVDQTVRPRHASVWLRSGTGA